MSKSMLPRSRVKSLVSAQSGKKKLSKCASPAVSERKRKGEILDGLTKRLVAERDRYCVRCGAPGDDPMHIFGRANTSIRWNLLCVHFGCRSCHTYLDTHPANKRIFFINHIGPENYELLSRARYWPELTLQQMQDLITLYRSSI